MMISVQKAAEIIKNGDVAAFPTETVYGLGADAQNISAVKKTFIVKGRPSDNPLIVHISRVEQVHSLAVEIPPEFFMLAEAFWPGPLTIVLKKQRRVPDIVTGGLKTVAIRMPDHPLALELIELTGPLTAPSANPSGKPSPTQAEHADLDYSGKIGVLDGGPTQIGIESTVLDLSSGRPEILRPGAVTAGMIENIINKKVTEATGRNSTHLKSPGTRYTHYKPDASVQWLDKVPVRYDPEIYYILHSGPSPGKERNIHSYHNNFEGLARDLYDHFRTADHLGYQIIQIQVLPDESHHPLIKALQNRISKALHKQ
ncbi:MAG: L-threonylcarbamoyladenylate synthase [Balneolaceae bacterium]